jgi:hypothetical protein
MKWGVLPIVNTHGSPLVFDANRLMQSNIFLVQKKDYSYSKYF